MEEPREGKAHEAGEERGGEGGEGGGRGEAEGPRRAETGSWASNFDPNGELSHLRGLNKTHEQHIEDEPSLLAPIVDAVRKTRGLLGHYFIQGYIETDWNLEDFLAGAEDAFATVLELSGDRGAEEDLRGMATEQIVRALRSTREDYEKAGLGMAIEVEEVRKSYLEGAYVVPQSAVDALEQTGEGGEVQGFDVKQGVATLGRTEMWLVAEVRFLCSMRSVLTNTSNDAVSARRARSGGGGGRLTRGRRTGGLQRDRRPLPAVEVRAGPAAGAGGPPRPRPGGALEGDRDRLEREGRGGGGKRSAGGVPSRNTGRGHVPHVPTSASSLPASTGTAAVMFSGRPRVTTMSSSMRTPMPRRSAGMSGRSGM